VLTLLTLLLLLFLLLLFQSLNNLAVVYTSQGRAQEALALLQAATQACPSYAEAYNNLGVLQRDVGAIPEAIASYEQSLQLCPTSRNAGKQQIMKILKLGITQHVLGGFLASEGFSIFSGSKVMG
jgi:tetratricopeptide (TPR) repeat protein